jgi:hypothetical protein
MPQTMQLILVLGGTLLGVFIANYWILAKFRKKSGQQSHQFKVINQAIKSIKNPFSDDTEEFKNISELSNLINSIKNPSDDINSDE